MVVVESYEVGDGHVAGEWWAGMSLGLFTRYGLTVASGAPPAFAPDDIAGLRLWLDADDASTITEEAGAVSQWDDKSGNANHATATGSTQPTTDTRTVNGRNALDFDQDRMSTPYVLTAASTIFAVFDADTYATATPAQRILGTYLGTGGIDAGTTLLDTVNGALRILNHDSATATVPNLATGPRLVRMERSAAGVSVSADTVEILASDSSDSTAAERNLWLGEDGNTTNNEWFNGAFCEVLAYNSILSSTDVEAVEAYLTGRWGLSFGIGSLPGLRLWLDASDASTIADTDGAVTSWTSKDPDARVFSQATAALQPATGVTTQNSLNTIDFAGDYLVTTAAKSVWNFMHNGTKSTLFAVMKFGNVDEPDVIAYALGTSAAAGSQVGMTVFFDDRSSGDIDKRVRTYVAAAVGAAVANNGTDGTWTPNTYRLLTHQLDPANATASNRSTINVNSGADIKTSATTTTPSTADSTGAFTIGADPAATFPLTGQIAAVVICEGALSDDAVAAAESELAGQWGITL